MVVTPSISMTAGGDGTVDAAAVDVSVVGCPVVRISVSLNSVNPCSVVAESISVNSVNPSSVVSSV